MRVPSVLATIAVAVVAGTLTSVDAREVSVYCDATYDIPASRGVLCSGAGAKPAGTACPKKGDVSPKDCHSHLPSLDGSKQGCVALEDAVYEVVIGETWGCVFPTVGCIGEPVVPAKAECATWVFGGDDLVDFETAPELVRGHRMLTEMLVGADGVEYQEEDCTYPGTNASTNDDCFNPASSHNSSYSSACTNTNSCTYAISNAISNPKPNAESNSESNAESNAEPNSNPATIMLRL